MPNYRRLFVPGGTTFFTVVTYNRSPIFQEDQARQILGRVIREVREEFPF